ncbi:MAG: Ribosomal RNA small subunit methyltransferase F, partial [Candidatus Peregrinibacteria bacterium Greene0416_62]
MAVSSNLFIPLDRYAPFTDLVALKAASARPLRKCIRVNTLKTTVEEVLHRASEQGWKLTPVPWCPEGFFIDREDRTEALGKDLLHLLGHVYLQEASSMLPPVMLGAKPGEAVLDMCAAPGSKTTQIAAAMSGRGLIVANEVQEKRMWTLNTACQRSGVTNVILTKKVGQWFGKQMTEQFDRVLCDAPCTAQGTVRKDSDALNFCGSENIAKMARLQMELLEAAIHATKVGGTIVYSTCTLTPEENEGVVLNTMNKFCDQLEVIDPRGQLEGGKEQLLFERAI